MIKKKRAKTPAKSANQQIAEHLLENARSENYKGEPRFYWQMNDPTGVKLKMWAILKDKTVKLETKELIIPILEQLTMNQATK